ncbi:hypothetical protein [Streptomyces sp. NPDC017529]|uniref:hypothetical protein n=1 Tax=Streptomyces sp. NPDC017529 TaxID=3365000 RepID=UPI0037899953
MLLLPAVAFAVLALAGTAYFDVHGRTEELRDRYAPTLVDLAHARVALTLAQQEAEQRLGAGSGEPLRQTGLVGLGERYPALLTEASQSLNNTVQAGALDTAQEQEVRVLSGLVVAYDDWVNWANSHHTSRPLRKAGMDYAKGLLSTGGTAVLARIDVLAAELRTSAAALADRRAVFSGTASAALLGALVFAFVVAGTLDFVRGRLRVRSHLLSVCALPVLLLLAVPAIGVTVEHRAQDAVKEAAERLGRRAVPRPAGPEENARGGPGAAVDKEDARLTRKLDATHPDAWATACTLALALGAAGAVGCGVMLFHYGREYLEIQWKRK